MNPLTEKHNEILNEIDERLKLLKKEWTGNDEASSIIEDIQHNVKRLYLVEK